MNVLLLCSQGMSTGMLCDRIAAAAKEDGCEMTVWAASEIKAREHVGKADIILLGPQVRYLKSRIEEMAEGTMDGKKVYNDIKKHMGDK